MKKKLFTLLTLMLCVCSGAWAAAVTDLNTISSDFTFIADDITSNGTSGLTKENLYADGYIFTPTGNSVATNKGKSTIDGVEHLNSLRLKNTQDQLCFKVAKSCKVTFYTMSHSSRGIQVGSSAGGTEFGTQPVSTTVWTVDITKGGTVYLSSFGGDFYFAGFTVLMLEPTSLSFATTSGTAELTEGTSYTLPALTKSPETITVTYSSSDESVATVDASTGAVTLLKAGTTIITAEFAGDDTYSKSSATFELTVTNSAAVDINVTYDISNVTGIVGVAPESFTIQETQVFTIPVNYTLYVEGKTLTGWSDGANTYAIGESVTAPATDLTLTPVFTDNTVSLSDRTNAMTLNFDFQRNNGAPKVQWENMSNLVWVTKATINGVTIDVPALFTTNPGKFNNTSWTDWCQINKGTVFTIPSEKGAVVTIEGFNVLGEGEGKTLFLTIDGSSNYTHAKTVNYTVTSETSTIDVEFGEEGSYYRYIKVALPAPVLPAVSNKMWNMSNFDTQTFSETTRIDNLEFAKDVVIDGSNKSYGNEFSSSRRAKTGAVGSKTSRFLHFRVAGNSKITVYGMSSNSSNQRNVIIDANGTELLNKKLTGDVLNKVETLYFGEEQDIYLYSTDGGINIYGIKVEAIPASEIIIPGYAKITYVTPYALDFSNVEGLKAYVATGASAAGVTTAEVGAVPAGTPLLLKGTAGTEYSVPVAAEASAPATNLLCAGDGTTEFDGTTYNYLLAADGKFYQISSGTIAVGKAYLHLDSAPAGARSLSVIFADDMTTGIETIANETKADNTVYNLGGQRVAQPSKGLYIVNGKKIIK